MCGSAKPMRVIALGVVTKHIPYKPQRDHSSNMSKKGRNICNRLNHKGTYHLMDSSTTKAT